MRKWTLLTGVLLAALLTHTDARAEAFGTPTIDGVIDGVYGAAEASDPFGDHWASNNNIDLGDLYVCNDATFWYFAFTVNDNIVTTNWGKYVLNIDTTNDTNGGTSDPWGRNVTISDPHKSEYTVRSWLDAQPYGPEDSQLWSWDQGTTTWNLTSALVDAKVGAGTTSVLEWKIAKADIGDPDTIYVEVWTTGGGGTDNAQDTSNDPADDWNATDWATTSVLSSSTCVAKQTGTDVTPPTVSSARPTLQDGAGDPDYDNVVVKFSEAVQIGQATNTANYTVTGATINSVSVLSVDTYQLNLAADLPLGSCITVEATGIADAAGNTIVDNNVTNVDDFYLTKLVINGLMNLHLQSTSYFPAADTFGIEGSLAPLTWDPLCDDLMNDAGTGGDAAAGDSIYAKTLVFANGCTGGLTDTLTVEYKFNHQCTNPGYESTSNHVYTLDGSIPCDTLNIWWEDIAPINLTDKDIDVIFFIAGLVPPFDTGDSLAVNGSQLPFDFNLPPLATSVMNDDGTGADSTAGDGIYSLRATFPTGTIKNFEYKHVMKDFGDTLWVYECDGQGNRNVFLNDSLFSTANPIVLDLLYWDFCGDVVGVDDADPESAIPGTAMKLFQNTPNPFNPRTSIEFSLPERMAVNLNVYDASGRLVKTLLDRELGAGAYTGGNAVVWDGTDNAGKPVSSGMYFYKLQNEKENITRKMTLIR